MNVPFYWDAAWVYAPGIQQLAENFSLFPNLETIEYSRGHPQLFFILGALWTMIFGSSLISIHSFALVNTLAIVASVFWILNKWTSPWVALLGSLILSLQLTFITHNVQVLPEMMLSLGILWSVYFFADKKYSAYAIAIVLSCFVKESAWVLGGLIFGLQVLLFVLKAEVFSWKRLLLVSTPLFLVILFLAYNYLSFGWILYPEHTGYLRLSFQEILPTLQKAYSFTFELEGRLYLFYLGLILFFFQAKQLPWWERILHFLIMGSVVKVVFGRIPFIPGTEPYLLPLILLIPWVRLTFPLFYSENKRDRFLALVFTFLPLFIVFSAMNFFTERYLLNCLALLTTASFLVIGMVKIKKAVVNIALGSLIIVPVLSASLNHAEHWNPSSLYLNDVQVTQAYVAYLEEEDFYNESIVLSFLEGVALNNKYAGYKSTNIDFYQPKKRIDEGANWVLLCNLTQGYKREDLVEYILQKEWAVGNSWAELYKRKTKEP
ncbi:MAG TPA: hypothetical protein DCS15_03010 [Flavobacteriales bacterium]|jgi:4-amino-4-deoxy-L-arabinose transferase-like glycosyltransferase|nr:hypothetical protein [Flavobacteriales bacterium]